MGGMGRDGVGGGGMGWDQKGMEMRKEMGNAADGALPTTHHLHLLPTTYYLQPATYYLLSATYYLLLTICYLLPTTYYSLLTTYYLLPTTYYLLLIT